MSLSVRGVVEIVNRTTLVFFLLVRLLRGIPADRGLPAGRGGAVGGGVEAGYCLGHFFGPIPHATKVSMRS